MKCHCIYFSIIYLPNNLLRENISNPSERNFFRFSFDVSSKILYINYFETPAKNWEKENYLQISKYFEVIVLY